MPEFPFSGDCDKRTSHCWYPQNVYTSYHAPSSRTGNRAMIGLANVTDFPAALDRFTAERGVDRFGWSMDPAIDSSHREVRKVFSPLITYNSNSGIGD